MGDIDLNIHIWQCAHAVVSLNVCTDGTVLQEEGRCGSTVVLPHEEFCWQDHLGQPRVYWDLSNFAERFEAKWIHKLL